MSVRGFGENPEDKRSRSKPLMFACLALFLIVTVFAVFYGVGELHHASHYSTGSSYSFTGTLARAEKKSKESDVITAKGRYHFGGKTPTSGAAIAGPSGR